MSLLPDYNILGGYSVSLFKICTVVKTPYPALCGIGEGWGYQDFLSLLLIDSNSGYLMDYEYQLK